MRNSSLALPILQQSTLLTPKPTLSSDSLARVLLRIGHVCRGFSALRDPDRRGHLVLSSRTEPSLYSVLPVHLGFGNKPYRKEFVPVYAPLKRKFSRSTARRWHE